MQHIVIIGHFAEAMLDVGRYSQAFGYQCLKLHKPALYGYIEAML